MAKKISARRKEEEVDLECLDGVTRKYKVKELLGPERDKYMELRQKKLVHDTQNRVIGIKTHEGMATDLLQFSVFDDKDVLVPVSEIDRWSTSAQQDLFMIAAEISGLKPKEEAQKEEGPTPTSGPAGTA